MKRGFFLGKFMPLHEGHILVCDVACSLVDELTVLVCTRDCEPIDGEARLRWVQQSVKNNVRVLHLDRDIPQEPSEHPDFWPIWKNTIEKFHPEPIDLVFGSDDYIIKLAKVLSAKPFLVDEERHTVPVSASLIRQEPFRHWQHIPQAVRPYYQQRVCVLGPESTGKSTLVEELAQRIDTSYIGEYGRTYDALYRQGQDWEDDDFLQLALGHAAISKETSKRAGPLVFEDTDLLQTIVWAKYLLNSVPDELQNLLNHWQPADHYLLLKPDVEWIDDGTRYSGDNSVREWFFDELLALLKAHEFSYEIIYGGNWHDRTAVAKDKVSALHQKS